MNFFGFALTRGFFETYEDFAGDNDKRNEQFGMLEPQPLGPNEIMFTFVLLGFAIFVSLLNAFAELINMKYFANKTSPMAWTENEMVPGPSQPSDNTPKNPKTPKFISQS